MLAYRLHANDGHTGRTRSRRNRMGSALDNVGASGGTKHRSRIAHDLVKHEQCKFDDMLQYFLERCLIDPNAAPNDARLSVLQSCLEGVLPICNSEDMKQRLVHYCTSRFDERSRHWAFADLANEALKKLHKVNISDTRPVNDDLHILFHQNDCAYIQPDRGHQAFCSPGVVLVSLAAAQLIVPDDCGDMMEWEDVVAGYACDGPYSRRSFAWPSILTSMEFKFCGNSSRQLPSKLAGLDLTPENPRITVMNTNLAGATSKQDEIEAETLENPSSPIVRCALYGADMLSRGPCMNHAIKLLLIGRIGDFIPAAWSFLISCFRRKIWIWWYDRQVIQTEGIDLIQDFPRFLILLFAFQRFELED